MAVSDVIFTFMVHSKIYHNISMTIKFHCQKDGITLSEGWYYIVRRMVLLCQKDGTTLSEGWYCFIRRMVLLDQKDGIILPHFFICLALGYDTSNMAVSDVIFTFMIHSKMYHNISMTIKFHCQKDGITLPHFFICLALKHHVSIK